MKDPEVEVERDSQPYVFLVDDDPESHFLHSRIIKRKFPNARIESFSDGRKALRKLLEASEGSNDCPTHLWLDLNMPTMDGWNFLEAVAVNARRIKCRPKITIVTSSPDPVDEAKALSLGIESFSQKFMTAEACVEILSSKN